MAYDEELAAQIRELVGEEIGMDEKRIFGGLAFLVHGNMAVAASSSGGLLVRVDPAQSDNLVATTDARPMVMRGREMSGWLHVNGEDIETSAELARWVNLGVTFARSLPPK